MKHFGMGKHSMYDLLWVEAEVMMEAMSKQYEKSNVFNPKNFVHYAVINIIAKFCYGERFGYEDPRLALIVKALEAEIFSNETLWTRWFIDISGIFAYLPKWLVRMTPEFKDAIKFFDISNDIVAKREKSFDRTNPESVVDVFITEREKSPDGVFGNPIVVGATIVDLFG